MMLLEVMDEIPVPSLSSSPLVYSDLWNNGYLEDALLEFSTECPKRRRLLPPCAEEPTQNNYYHIDVEKSFWNLNPVWHQPAENFYCMNQNGSMGGFSDENISKSMSMSRINEEIETPQETIFASEESPAEKLNYNNFFSKAEGRSRLCFTESDKESNKRAISKVAYPFALVKPGGSEGDVTLNDINERILMRPTRPVRHPVGDFACRPCVSAEGSLGLSGKAVVALTRIHTQGRGTITIIRTKG
ncbi:protein XRI1 [Senna tora]|uniref:Protein XRI1 n=1 Tax=Senna tora TaxID=362788 RepID=A0A834TSC6_9FABA|nr:protein XRI1 [Senna tora]